MTAVEEAGVRLDYEHRFKRITPAESITLRGAVLKWYDIAPAEAPVPLAIRELAHGALEHASTSGELALAGELGFVILHRCGESFYFLLVSTWRNDNELWETVWAKDGGDADAFEPWPIGRGHRPTYCVWELGAVCHEQRVWSRYLRSSRDAKAKEAYLGDSFAGLV
jgi:hypothetical protein